MQPTPSSVSPITVTNGVVSLNGYGVRVAVERGQLVLADGTGNARRAGTLSRATSGLKRLVIRGQGEFITFDALHWLFDIGASLTQIGYDGQVVAVTGPQGLNDPRLRRAQALAPWNATGLDLMRDLLREKLEGQASVLARIPDSHHAAVKVRGAVEQLQRGDTLESTRSVEASAALAYWRAWEAVEVTFVRRDQDRVPKHWRSFGARMSPLSAKPRYAINPPNAILNYLYAVLEAETTIAARAVGLDPGMGILHVDVQSRDSLAFDLMEPIRPKVDAFLLDLLKSQPLAAAMFFETGKGVCRVMPPLAHTLAETAETWRKAVAPVVERVAKVLHESGKDISSPAGRSLPIGSGSRAASRQAPTRLTQSNHRTALGSGTSKGGASSTGRAALPNACRSCGVVLEVRNRRQYCPDCLPERQAEVAHAMGSRPRSYADRWGLSPDVAPDPERFNLEILPRLQSVPLQEMARVTGLGFGACSRIRLGRYVPHPRYWDALRADVKDGERANPARRVSGRRSGTAPQQDAKAT